MKKREILIDEETLQERIKQLGKQISEDYKDQDLTLICILKGAMFFFTDLAKNITIDANIEVMKVSSYIGEDSSGKVNIKLDIEKSIQDKNILIVEDIIDSGRTMKFLLEYLSLKNPKSIKICTLLDKKGRREIDNIDVDYVGFKITNRFVIGYGLDLNEKYRNLREINCIIDDDDNEEKKLQNDILELKKQLKSHK